MYGKRYVDGKTKTWMAEKLTHFFLPIISRFPVSIKSYVFKIKHALRENCLRTRTYEWVYVTVITRTFEVIYYYYNHYMRILYRYTHVYTYYNTPGVSQSFTHLQYFLYVNISPILLKVIRQINVKEIFYFY